MISLTKIFKALGFGKKEEVPQEEITDVEEPHTQIHIPAAQPVPEIESAAKSKLKKIRADIEEICNDESNTFLKTPVIMSLLSSALLSIDYAIKAINKALQVK